MARSEETKEVLTVHTYQDWDTNDGLLYPGGSAQTVCACGATPDLPPPEGDWAWWVAHVVSLIDKEGTDGTQA